MNCRDEFYIRACDCGRIHVESLRFRRSYHPAEFVALLRMASGMGSLNEAAALQRASEEDHAMSRDSRAGRSVHSLFSGERAYGVSRVD